MNKWTWIVEGGELTEPSYVEMEGSNIEDSHWRVVQMLYSSGMEWETVRSVNENDLVLI